MKSGIDFLKKKGKDVQQGISTTKPMDSAFLFGRVD